MKQRTAFVLAIGLTAFVLVIVGAVGGQFIRSEAAASSTEDPSVAEAASVQQDFYSRLVEALNSRLEQVLQQQSSSEPTANAQDSYPIDAAMAASIALNVTPNANLLKTPELVSFQGIVAYEVILNSGNVYVDATTGSVLYNGTTSSLNISRNPGDWEEHEHEHEHEGWDD